MSITAMKQALEALEKATPVKAKDPQMQADAIVALRTAIAEAEAQPAPKQEPLSSILTKWKTGMICGQDAMVLLFRHYSSNPTVQAQPAKPLTVTQIKAEFSKLYPKDLPLIELAENNRDFRMDAIGAQHHLTAFNLGVKAAEATHNIKEHP